MVELSSLLLLFSSCLIWRGVEGQMLGEYAAGQHRVRARQNNGKKDTSAFNIVNGRILTPGLGIILSPQPFTPMGGDFLQVALDVSGDGKLNVPPQNTDDPLTQIHNITLFLTSNSLGKNFTISNFTTTTAPFANIMIQESGSTVKHINFEWPDCLVGDNNKDDLTTTARGDYNISIHQNFRLNGSEHYSIFNLPISVTNSISQFPGANQLLSKPPPGPLNANGGRMNCDSISNPLMSFAALVASVNNPPGQPFQDIQIETTARNDGGQVGGNGKGGGGGQGQGISSQPNGAQGALGPSSDARRLGRFRARNVGVWAGIVGLGSVRGW